MGLARLAVVGGAVLLALSTLPARAEKYVYTTIDPPGSSYTGVRGVNDLDQVVGYATVDKHAVGFVWSGGVFTYLDPHPKDDSQFVEPNDINVKGKVVGGYLTNTENRPFVFKDGTLRRPVISPHFASLTAINRSGVIVGSIYDPQGPSGGDNAFFYRAGVLTLLQTEPKVQTTAQDINDHGMIVGVIDVPLQGGFGFKESGFIYADGQLTSFDVPQATVTTHPLSIGPTGIVAGLFEGPVHNIGSDVARGFVRARNGAIRIFLPPGAREAYVAGVTPSGYIIGQSDDGGFSQGFLCVDRVYHTIAFPGADATTVRSVNQNASIVGSYYKDRAWRGYIATCPGAPGSCVD